jgi:DNA-binding NtrC family response regulator
MIEELKRVLWINLGYSPDDVLPSSWQVLCQQPTDALNELKTKDFDAIMLELPLPHRTPGELLDQLQRLAPETPVLIRDPEATLSDALRLGRQGAFHMLEIGEQVGPKMAEAIEERARRRFKSAPEESPGWDLPFVGASPAIRQVCQIIRMIAPRRSTVLITGETGTGKELAARSLHLAGPRSQRSLVALNCSALPEALLEAELFGHVRGAFTGALQTRIGRFEQAHGGTLFLDEIGELPLELQAKLLRVLQEREFQRLGSSETIRVDVRVVAATNADLAREIEAGKFREDLYYRLNVVPLHLPPLRNRREDIPALAAHFVDKICQAEAMPRKSLTDDAIGYLSAYSWPGNVRQLENAVETAVALSGDRQILSALDFSLPARSPTRPQSAGLPVVSVPDAGLDYENTLAAIERSILEQALAKTGGNKKAAAEMLRLKRTTLSAKVRNLEAVRLN